jgi:hypothetical protein
MRDHKEYARAAREVRDSAKESAKKHSDDLAGMKDVAAKAAADLEVRRKYRRKRSASTRISKPK